MSQSNSHPGLVSALLPALHALDVALADPHPWRQSVADRAGPPLATDAACHALRAAAMATLQATAVLSEASTYRQPLLPLCLPLYDETARLIGVFHRIAAQANGGSGDDGAQPRQRLADSARDALVTSAHALADVMLHASQGKGRIELDVQLSLPTGLAELQTWQPKRLAYARHRVQWALAAQDPAAPSGSDDEALRRLLAAQERLAVETARGVFWSVAVGAALGGWLAG
jgi:hypothetical protein